MQAGARGGFGLLRNLIQRAGGARQARQLLQNIQRVLPAAEMTGVRGISEPVRRAAVQSGLMDELTAFPSVVSRQGGNVGLMGSRQVPTARQLGQAPKPQFGPGAGTPTAPAGSRSVNTLVTQPMQGPRQRGGALVRTAQDNVPAPAARTRFTEDLISQPSVQGPVRAPAQGPSPAPTNAVQSQLDLRFPSGARSAAEFVTSKGAVRPAGTNVAGQPYRGGPMATERNIETIRSSLAPSVADVVEGAAPRVAQGQGSFFLDNAPDIWTGSFRMRPELIRQLPREVQQRIGTTMMREAADLGPAAPRPAFGPSAGPSAADSIVDAAFGGLRNAAAGARTVDLSSLPIDPRILAAVGLGTAGLTAAGVASLFGDRNRTGETTAGAPPETPTQPLFLDSDGSALGSAPGVVQGGMPNVAAAGGADLSAPVVTGGGAQQESTIREALAQSAPQAAAVMRAVEPMSPEKYRSIEDYAAARQAYAQAKPDIQALMRFMEGQSPTAGGGLAAWAASHSSLAFQYQAQQQRLKNPAANQQSAETITTRTVTAPIGSEVSAAAVGNAEATANAAVAPTQGSFDMVDVTRPQVQPNLQRVQEFIRNQAPRSAMYAGY